MKEMGCDMVEVLPLSFDTQLDQLNIMEGDVIENWSIKLNLIESTQHTSSSTHVHEWSKKIVFEKLI